MTKRIVKFFLLLQQENRCGICDKVLDGCALITESDVPQLDHNHKTGEVRGVLCHKCNVGMGYFKESISSLQKAIEYLERNGRYESI